MEKALTWKEKLAGKMVPELARARSTSSSSK